MSEPVSQTTGEASHPVCLCEGDLWRPAQQRDKRLERKILMISHDEAGERIHYHSHGDLRTCTGTTFRAWVSMMKADLA